MAAPTTASTTTPPLAKHAVLKVKRRRVDDDELLGVAVAGSPSSSSSVTPKTEQEQVVLAPGEMTKDPLELAFATPYELLASTQSYSTGAEAFTRDLRRWIDQLRRCERIPVESSMSMAMVSSLTTAPAPMTSTADRMRSTSSASEEQRAFSEETLRVMKEHAAASDDLLPVFEAWIAADGNHQSNQASIAACMDLLALTIQLSRRARCIQTAKTIIKRILADHLRPIYRYLSSHTRLPTPALRLLAAITHFSTAATRDLFVRFNFTLKALPVVMAQRKGGVRAWYLRFVMGFWKMGDATVKRGVLELKDFVGFMFNGLYADDKGLVRDFLESIHANIILDHDVARSLKVTLFRPANMIHLTRLYGSKEHAETVHRFFMRLCAEVDVGLNFKSDGWYSSTHTVTTGADVEGMTDKVNEDDGVDDAGTSDHISNKPLLLVITNSSLRPLDDDRQRALLLAILTAAPELVHHYWRSVATSSFDPTPTTHWLAWMSLLTAVIGQPVPAFAPSAHVACPPVLHVVMSNVLPAPPVQRAALVKGLLHKQHVVRHATLAVLLASFDKLNAVLGAIDTQVLAQYGSNADIGGKWRALRHGVIEEMRKRVPELQVIIAMLAKSDNEVVVDIEAEQPVDNNDDEMMSDTASTTTTATTGGASDHLILIGTLRLLKFYAVHFPDAASSSDSRFDFGKLLTIAKVDRTALNASATDEDVTVALHTLQLLALHVREFKWSAMSGDGGLSNFGKLLTMAATTSHSMLREELCTVLLPAVMRTMQAFDVNPLEVDVWIRAALVLESSSKAVIAFLDRCCLDAAKQSLKLIDEYREFLTGTKIKVDIYNGTHPAYPFSPIWFIAIRQLRYVLTHSSPGDAATVSAFVKQILVRIMASTTSSSPTALVSLIERFAADAEGLFREQLNEVVVALKNVAGMECTMDVEKELIATDFDSLIDSIALTPMSNASLATALLRILLAPGGEPSSICRFALMRMSVVSTALARQCNELVDVIQQCVSVAVSSSEAMHVRVCNVIAQHSTATNNPELVKIVASSGIGIRELRRLLERHITQWTRGPIDSTLAETLAPLLTDEQASALVQRTTDEQILQALLFSGTPRTAIIDKLLPKWCESIKSKTDAVSICLLSKALAVHTSNVSLPADVLQAVCENAPNTIAALVPVMLQRRISADEEAAMREVFVSAVNNAATCIDLATFIEPFAGMPLVLFDDDWRQALRMALVKFINAACVSMCHVGVELLNSVAQIWFKLGRCSIADADAGALLAHLVRGTRDPVLAHLHLALMIANGATISARSSLDILLCGLKCFVMHINSDVRGYPLAFEDFVEFILKMPQSTWSTLPFDGDSTKVLTVFVLSTLKLRLVDEFAMRLLQCVVVVVYKAIRAKTDNIAPPFPLAVLFDMVVGHSRFREVMSDHVGDAPRHAVMRLLHTIMVVDAGMLDNADTCAPPTTLKIRYIPLLLRLFTATATPADRLIVDMLWMVERFTGASILHHVVTRGWGERLAAAAADAKTNVDDGFDLTDITDAKRMMETVRGLDVNATLEPSVESIRATVSSAKDSDGMPVEAPTYHAPFFLMLIAHHVLTGVPPSDELWQPMSTSNIAHEQGESGQDLITGRAKPFDMGAVVETNALGLVISCLACADIRMRSLAYIVLDKLWTVFEAARLEDDLDEKREDGNRRAMKAQQQADNGGDEEVEDAADHPGVSQRKLARREYMRGLLDRQRSGKSVTRARQLVSGVKEKRQVYLLLNALRNAVVGRSSSEYPRLPSIITTFVAQCIPIVQRPDSELYPVVNRFLLQRPFIDTADIPLFYSMLQSSNADCWYRERAWMIMLIRDGFKSEMDWPLIKRRHAIDLLMTYYSTPYIDDRTRRMVVDAVLGPIQLQDVRFPFGQLASWMAFIARISDDVAEWAVDVKERALAGLLSHVENEVAGRAKGNAEQDGEVDEAENDDGDVESDASESSDETSGDDSDSSDDLDSSDDTVSTTSAASSASVASSSTSSANSSDSDSHSDSENEATSSTPNYTPRSRFADHLLSILLQHIDTTRRSTATARTTKRLHDLAEQFSIKFPQHRSAVAAAFRNGR